jgi:peptidoglycan/LPS O-acetylase OafA/YrhL
MTKPKTTASSKIFFQNLDGLRFLAFLMVFLSHTLKTSFNNIPNVQGTFLKKIFFLFVSGEKGVSIFFVLSGFLITYLILSEIEVTRKLNVGFFYIRRVLRIWPLYYVAIVIAMVIYPLLREILHKPAISHSHPLFYFVFLSNFDVINSATSSNSSISALEGITWSVAVEEQFYLLWPLLFLIVPKKFYKFIFLGFIAVSMIFRAFHRYDGTVLYYHSLSVCGDLAIGGMSAYLAVYSKRFKQLLFRLPKILILAIYLLGIIYLMYGSDIFTGSFYPAFSRLFSGIFFAFIIIEQNYCEHSFYKFSKSKKFTFWGKYTYGLYLLHPLCLFILDIILKRFNIDADSNFLIAIGAAITGLGFSLSLSYLSYEYYEKKFLALKNKFDVFRRRNQKVTNLQPSVEYINK